MSIFKANDIRGVYGSELTDQDAYKIGRALVTFLKAGDVIVGRDMRTSSPSLSQAVIKGILDQGANVIDLDLIDTPGLYFATAFWKKPGIMVTASHNPAPDNGFVITYADALPMNEESGLKQIEKLVAKNVFKEPKTKGTITDGDISREYPKHMLSFIDPKIIKKMRVVIDAGNGMGGMIAPWVYKELPVDVVPLYYRLDGSFPHHVPNPAIYSNLKALSEKVKETVASFGIAYDGDADRAAFVDERGEIIEGSVTGAIIARYLLQQRPKSSIVCSSTCSRILEETVKQYGGKALKERVGHTFMKVRMRKAKALFGVENTGHFFYKDNFYADSGIITSLLMLEIYSKQPWPMSRMVKEFKKYYKCEEINFPVKDPEKVMARLAPMVKQLKPNSIEKFDGISAVFDRYWFSLRASHTEPLIRLSIEAVDRESGEDAKASLEQWLAGALK